MTARWVEIRASGPRSSRDAAAALLIEAGSPGVLEEETRTEGRLVSVSRWDDTGEVPEEAGLAPEGRAGETLTAYLPEDGAPIKALAGRLERLGWKFKTSSYKDRDWSREWKKGIRPVMVSYKGRSVVVKPTWIDVKKRPGDVVVEIDPGMAFGTGGHPTTRLCLKALLGIVAGGDVSVRRSSFLDVGTGSGVLAIAARKLGFGRAAGNDLDPVALKVARKNSRSNGTSIIVSSRGVEDLPGRYTVVAANILSGVLTTLAAPIAGKVEPGGFLVLSGILANEVPEILEAYQPLGLRRKKTLKGGEWAALVLRKTSGAKSTK